MGFDGIPDFFGKYYPLLGSVFSFSLIFGVVEAYQLKNFKNNTNDKMMR